MLKFIADTEFSDSLLAVILDGDTCSIFQQKLLRLTVQWDEGLSLTSYLRSSAGEPFGSAEERRISILIDTVDLSPIVQTVSSDGLRDKGAFVHEKNQRRQHTT